MSDQLSLFSAPHSPAPEVPADQALLAAQARLRESADKFVPMGRPVDSSCACGEWPCPCRCHKDQARKSK
jgi:hypothetical protein